MKGVLNVELRGYNARRFLFHASIEISVARVSMADRTSIFVNKLQSNQLQIYIPALHRGYTFSLK